MMWKDTPPFRAAIVKGVGEERIVQLLEPRETFLEVVEELKTYKGSGLTFIRNGNGASILPSRVTPPPEPRKKK